MFTQRSLRQMNKLILKITFAIVAILVVGYLTLSPLPAQARLDELIQVDAPYLAPLETGATTKNIVDIAVPNTYMVRIGDTLSEIAYRHGVKVDELAKVNGLKNNDCIIMGQILLLPGNVFPYQVCKGDSLGLIASRYRVTERKLAEINGLRNYDHLLVGQQLMIPAGQGGGNMQISRSLPLKQLSWPVVGWISSPYGMRDGAMHEGIDIAADDGQSVRAVKGGRVVLAGSKGTYGKTVIIDHGNGLRSLYAHNSRILVREGQRVLAGQTIARVGSTGRSTGPHVHLEVQLNGVPIDPILCLQRRYA